MSSDSTWPLVSIIIPSFNQGRFIRKTIESCLEQDYRPLEILVIDGGSKDETLDVLKSFSGTPGFSFISEPDKGVVDAVNKGFARATGTFAAIQSSDDYYLPGAVRAAVDELMQHPELAFVFGDIMKVDSEGRELDQSALVPFSLENILSVRTWIPQPSTFFRLDLAHKHGGWREAVPYAADTDLWFRMAFEAPAKKINRVLAARTMHDAQRNRQGEKIIRDYTRMIAGLAPLAAAPRRVRDAAWAGVIMTTLHYRPGGYWYQWWMQLRAVVKYPPLLEDIGVAALVPGWAWFRRQLTRWRRPVGAMLFDCPRYTWALMPYHGWIRARNRNEQRISGARGIMISGGMSSSLAACESLPFLGRWLMSRAIREWPFSFSDTPVVSGAPRISFVIPHRGRDREPLLRATIATIFAQEDVPVECIVVEQSPVRELYDLPAGVKYVHLNHSGDPQPWRKSWAFNQGVAAASAPIVICHDSDILVPRRYAAEIAGLFASGTVEVAHLQRFLFYLDSPASQKILRERMVQPVVPEQVRQDWQGGTLAITRDAYAMIGGFDERFSGWTGEDREFFDRCRALKQSVDGYLPFIHLWHQPQEQKHGEARTQSIQGYEDIMRVPRADRIKQLVSHA